MENINSVPSDLFVEQYSGPLKIGCRYTRSLPHYWEHAESRFVNLLRTSWRLNFTCASKVEKQFSEYEVPDLLIGTVALMLRLSFKLSLVVLLMIRCCIFEALSKSKVTGMKDFRMHKRVRLCESEML